MFLDLQHCREQHNMCTNPALIEQDGFVAGVCQELEDSNTFPCSCIDGYYFDLRINVCRGGIV